MGVSIKVNGAANSLVHKGSNGVSVATIPDVCKTPTPGGPVPMPYPNVSQSNMLSKGTTTVKTDGMMAAIKGSEFSMSNGDNPGVAGGVKSSTFMKESTWILYSFDVKMNGKNACRLSDKKFQNHQNTADLAGELQIPRVLIPPPPLQDIANCCNKAVDCSPQSKGKGCRSRGVHKHTCCKNAINRRKAQTDSKGNKQWSNVKPEHYHAPKGKHAASRLDVQITTGGKISHIYDFKFNCTKTPTMSDVQKKKYQKRFKGAKIVVVPARGAMSAPLPKKACAGAKPASQC